MKNSEIHNGLPENEIRDFLSRKLSELFDKEIEIKKNTVSKTDDPIDWSIKILESDIEYLQKKLKIYKDRRAVVNLIKQKNWGEFDVSDETINDTGHNLCMNFIGTEEEYEKLIKSLE